MKEYKKVERHQECERHEKRQEKERGETERCSLSLSLS